MGLMGADGQIYSDIRIRHRIDKDDGFWGFESDDIVIMSLDFSGKGGGKLSFFRATDPSTRYIFNNVSVDVLYRMRVSIKGEFSAVDLLDPDRGYLKKISHSILG